MSDTGTGRDTAPRAPVNGDPLAGHGFEAHGRRMTAAELAAELHPEDEGPRSRAGSGVGGRAEPAAATSGVGATPEIRAAGVADAPEHGSPSSIRGGKVRIGDRIFAGVTAGSGIFIVLVITAVAVFLIAKAWPAISKDQASFLTSRDWSVNGGTLRFGIVDLLWVTVVSSIIAMILAVPVGIGIALFITQYAPRRLSQPIAAVVDLLAAIPSIVYGVWGLLVFGPKIQPVADGLASGLGFIPFFADKNIATRTIFTAAIVLAVMILPIITAVSRDVFERTPRANNEAALALGATRWEMIRMSVLPYGKAGVVSGAMLGLGRALGETIAVTLILATLGAGSPFTFSIFSGGETFASKIANNAAEFSDPSQTGAYIAAGLVLFVLTFAVNAAARFVVNRGVKA